MREKIGKDPIEGGDQHLIYTATGPVPLPGTAEALAAQETAKELAAARGPKLLTAGDGDGEEPPPGKPVKKRRHYDPANEHVLADRIARLEKRVSA